MVNTTAMFSSFRGEPPDINGITLYTSIAEGRNYFLDTASNQSSQRSITAAACLHRTRRCYPIQAIQRAGLTPFDRKRSVCRRNARVSKSVRCSLPQGRFLRGGFHEFHDKIHEFAFDVASFHPMVSFLNQFFIDGHQRALNVHMKDRGK